MEANTIIIKKFKELKSLYPFALSLKRISGRYYVYKESGIWEKELKRHKTISEYLGRIDESGRYIKKRRSAKIDLETAKALIEENGGEVIWHTNRPNLESYQAGESKPYLKETDLKILTALSMNARIPASRLAEICGINKQKAYYHIKSLEKELGIKYILELNIERLGYLQYLILIKFEGNMPTQSELEDAISNEPRIQFAVITKGDYDLIMYLIDEDHVKAHENLVTLRSKTPFDKYKANWILTYFAQAYSFVPIRDQFITRILSDKVWFKSKGARKPGKNQLKIREYNIIKELNKNSSINFTELDKLYNMSKGTSRYAYQTLQENGIIVRPTISATKTSINYIGVILISNIDYSRIKENRYKLLQDEIQYDKVLNKYALLGNIGAPTNGAISFLPITSEGNLDLFTQKVEKDLEGSIVKSLIVTKIIIGALCYRRFDNMYSNAYKLLIKLNKIKQTELKKY